MSQEAEIAERVEQLLDKPVSALGFQLLEVQYRSEGRWTLRLFIDGPDGVNLDDCGAVSELAGRILDVEDPIPTEFSLEVSSPGIFRPLKTAKHFRQSIGKTARFTLATEFMADRKKRTIRGKIESVGEEAIVVTEKDERMEIPLEGIHSAKLDPDI